MAINALTKELERLAEINKRRIIRYIKNAADSLRQNVTDLYTIEFLSRAVGEFVTRVERSRIAPETADALVKVLRVNQYYVASADALVEEGHETGFGKMTVESLQRPMAAFIDSIMAVLDRPIEASVSGTEFKQFIDTYQKLKHSILRAGAENQIPIDEMGGWLERNSRIRRSIEQVDKGDRMLAWLKQFAEGSIPTETESVAESS